MSKILITGSNGYVGRQLVAQLRQSGYDVTSTSRSTPSLTNSTSNQFFSLNLTDRERTLALIKGFDVVIHCAATTRGNNAEEMEFNNVLSTRNLLESCVKNNIVRMIFLSTDLAYDPNGVYAQTKLAAEKMIKQSEIKGLIVRMGTILGEYDPDANSTLSKLVKFVSKTPFIPLINGGSMGVNITAIQDLVDFLKSALENQSLYPNHSVIPIFSARMKLYEIIECIEEGLGVRKIHLNIPLRPFSPLLKVARTLHFLRGISNRLLQMTVENSLLQQPSHYLKNQMKTRTLIIQMAERSSGKLLSNL